MLEVKNLVKVYKTKGGVETKALNDVSVNFPETGLVFLLGKSGSGKSTLLNMIGGLDRPDSGEIIVKGRSSKDFSQADFDSYRNTYIGFIFQEYNVLNEFNIEQNISLALQLQGKKNDKEAVNALLKEVDLEGFNKRKPNTLSGGQKQRIAIARALIKQPEIIMADEPTGALDSVTGKQVLETLKKLSKTKLVIIVSHDQDFAEEYGDRIIELKDGKILTDKTKEYVPPKAINEKMQIINGNIIDIKKGSALTEADFKQIYQMIKKQDKEVLISTGEDNIKVTKKAARISDDGKGERFSDTKEVQVKQYDGKQTKFIRSHMPFSRSFKMGASSLKTKPIRLIFTILLATVSFTMFGVASALMLYNESYSIATALEHEVRRSEAVKKFYDYKRTYSTIDNKTGQVVQVGSSYSDDDTTYFGAQEVKDLNDANNNKFLGVFNFQRWDSDEPNFEFPTVTIPTSEVSKDYYNKFVGFYGLSDAGAEFFSANGFNLNPTGTHPVKVNDLAISNYTFDLLKASGFTVTDYNSIVGKKLQVAYWNARGMRENIEFTITGVYDFGPLSNTFDTLKEAQGTQTDADRSTLVGNLKDYLKGSFYTTGYVSPAFYEQYGYVPQNYEESIQSYRFKGYDTFNTREEAESREVTTEWPMSAYIADTLKSNTKYYNTSLTETTKIDLQDNQVFLQYPAYHNSLLRDQYYDSLNDLFQACSSYSEAEFNEIKEEINNYWSVEPTHEVSQAFARLREGFADKWDGELGYPEADADYTLVKTYLEGIYPKGLRQQYLSSIADGLGNYYDHESSFPSNWSEVDTLRNRMWNDELDPLTEEEYTQLSTMLQADIVPGNEYVIKGAMLTNLDDYSHSYYRGIISRDLNEIYGISDVYTICSELNYSYGENPEVITKITEALTKIYNDIYGVDPTFEYNINFMTYKNHSSFEVPTKIYGKDVAGNITEYTVAGLVDFGSSDSMANVFTRSALKDYFEQDYSQESRVETSYTKPADEKYAYVIAKTEYSKSDVALFTANHDTYRYDMTNKTYSKVSSFTNMIGQMKTIFLIVGAVTGALSALLLLNFISVSISSKNKDIGILRAVGARGSDVFKIFFSESSVIAIICFILAAVGGWVVCYYINGSIRDTLGIALLDYGFINILLVLGVTLVISFIATIIPVSIASRKPPVEAIRAL